jgi:surface antigen
VNSARPVDVPESGTAYPTRRALREAEAREAQLRAAQLRPAALARPAAANVSSGPRRVDRVVAPAFPDAKAAKAPRKRFTVLLTMTAVGGLFACAALPAYAISDQKSTTSSVSTDAAAAVIELAGHGVDTAAIDRGSFDATTRADIAAQTQNAAEQANYDAYLKSGAQELGDDYPWYSALSYNQGGGLSPLNYFYRECVDFVAWRLNRDAGSTHAPFKYMWSDLTPGGGNASQWLYAWRAHGWTVSTTPKVGSVAWFPYNHVAYVAKVNADGTVLLEEYNYNSDHLYGQRTVKATDVAEYLYAPPR